MSEEKRESLESCSAYHDTPDDRHSYTAGSLCTAAQSLCNPPPFAGGKHDGRWKSIFSEPTAGKSNQPAGVY